MSIWTSAPKNSQAVYEYLKDRAERMRTTTYGEVASAIGLDENREIAPVSLARPLGFIRDEICIPRGLPWLNALAVNAKTGLPGDSFLPQDVNFADADRVLWRGVVLAVFAYPWALVKV